MKLWRNTTFRMYVAAILKTCHKYNFFFIIIGFPDPENMRVDTEIVFLNGLEAKILPKTQLSRGDFVLPSKKIPQGCQAGIRLIPTQKDTYKQPR